MIEPISKKTVQKPVEVSTYEQVIEILGGNRSGRECLVIARHGDSGLKFRHVQANRHDGELQSFCRDVDAVFVLDRATLEEILDGRLVSSDEI